MQNMKHKYFIIVFIVSILSLLITLFFKGLPSTVVLLIGIAIILFITKVIWESVPNKYSVRIFSFVAASSIVMSYGFWQKFLDAAVKTCFPDIAKNFQQAPYILIFIFIAAVTWIVNYFNNDNTAMGKHQNSIGKELPNISYKEEIKGIATYLSDELRDIDIKTNWSSWYFTPLDAEVEVIKGTHRKKKIMDLLAAIKKSEDRLFLILGDPGSGKSVSLRKLCQDLSEETKKTGKIPVYINLKEWQIDRKWDRDNPPTTEGLMNFVLANVGKRNIFIRKFFNRKIDGQTYFERLYLTGHLFFVFDSFDEIPSVLAEDENSWLIKELSKVIFTFLKGTRDDFAQGILASRLFRKPTQEFQCTTTLEIRPFSEKKIIKTFERNGKINNEIIKDFFKNHSHLVPVARNPFAATLISEYIESNNGALPTTHAELYENYLRQLLDDCEDQMRKKGISKEQIIFFAKKAAASMSKSSLGWEIETQTLRDIDPNAEKYIDILKFARIGRGNTGDESIFSFVHRRFAEYFVAKNMLDNKDTIDLQAIPKDSQLRDALVIYCEIADDETATKIADFCWEIIVTANDLQRIEVVHALRFLRDAYKGRKDCLKNFNTQLAKYMRQQINYNNNILTIKLIVECVSLLDNDSIEQNILLALLLDNYWITETAFYSCRNIPSLSKEILNRFEEFFNKMPIKNILQSYSDYNFSLSLSEPFINLRFWVKFKIADFFFFLIITMYYSTYYFICGMIFRLIPITALPPIMALVLILFFYFRKFVFPLKWIRIFMLCFLVFSLQRNIYFYLEFGMLYSLFFYTLFDVDIIISPIAICLIVIYPVSIIWKNIFNNTIGYFLRKEILTCIYVVFFSAVCFFNGYYVFDKIIVGRGFYFTILGIIIIVVTPVIIIPYFQNLFKYFYQMKLLKKIDIQSCNNRETIYRHFNAFDNKKVKLKYVSMLELYVHNVSGEWPDKDIFKITSNPANIRLAQLEEKWLGINR